MEEIYRYAETITGLKQIVEYLRVEDAYHADIFLEKYKSEIDRICQSCAETDFPETAELQNLTSQIYRFVSDMIVKADLIENALVPVIEKWVQSLGSIQQQLDEEYQAESTSSGYLTLKNLRTGTYLHSNNNPMEEAKKQIEFFFEPKAEQYAVLGCGLGYQVYQLYQRSKGSVKIFLYEENPQIVEYAKLYGVLDWIPEGILQICTKDSVYSFLKKVGSEAIGAFMHYPSLLLIKDEVIRNTMLQAYGEQNTPLIHKQDSQINFWRNVHSGAKLIADLDKSIVKREAVIVAAGPSLDDFMDVLRRWQGQKTIIAVGTVLAKLLKAGIRPDLVVVMDPQQRTLKQIEGAEDADVPMILDATAYWQFARIYQGEKYLVLTPQNQEILEYGQKNRINVWPSGGTVTALAIEVAIQFQAKEIYLAGVDLAYPGGVSHADGTMDRKTENTDGMKKICGVGGRTVYSTDVFEMYRRWIEEHIKKYPHIKWYNLSTKGARIEGTAEIGEKIIRGVLGNP